MQHQRNRDRPAPEPMFLHSLLIAPILPLRLTLRRRPLRRSHLPQQLPQFHPRALLGRQERHTRLLGVGAHEDGDEQCEDEHSRHQVEHDEEHGVALRRKVPRLQPTAHDRLRAPHHVGPALLAICEIDDAAAAVVADLHLAVEEIDAVDGEGDQQRQRDEDSRQDPPPRDEDNGVKGIPGAVTDMQQSQSPERLERPNSSRNSTVIQERRDNINPQGNQHPAINKSPQAAEIRIRGPETAIRNHLDDSLDAKHSRERHIRPDEPVPQREIVRLKVLLLVQRRRHTSQHDHRQDGRIDERRERVPHNLIRLHAINALRAAPGTDDALTEPAHGVIRLEQEHRGVVVWVAIEVVALGALAQRRGGHGFAGHGARVEALGCAGELDAGVEGVRFAVPDARDEAAPEAGEGAGGDFGGVVECVRGVEAGLGFAAFVVEEVAHDGGFEQHFHCGLAVVEREGLDLLEALFVLGDVEILLDDSNKHIYQNEEGQDEPADNETRAHPRRIVVVVERLHIIQDARPVLTRQDLVQPQERIPDGKERRMHRLTLGVVRRYIASKHLHRQDRNQERNQEHKQHQVQNTRRITQHLLNQFPRNRHRPNNTVDSNNLKDSQPRIRLSRIADGRQENDSRDNSQEGIESILPAARELAEIAREAEEDLNIKGKRDHDLRDEDEVCAPSGHASAATGLAHEAEDDDEDPEPEGLGVDLFEDCGAAARLDFLDGGDGGVDHGEGAALALFADDLEGGGDDGDEERLAFNAQGASRTQIPLASSRTTRAILVDPRQWIPRYIVKMSTTELEIIRIIRLSRRINPRARAAKTGLERLDADNGKEQPEEADQKGHVDQQRCRFLQTLQDNRRTVRQPQESQNPQTANHLEEVEVLSRLHPASGERTLAAQAGTAAAPLS
ncbi:hypothetical protein V494_04420 [Pseudogymnoascus sp. VKM F-4513 (FW-928)]|nr:hypothetical protein V494_04420 [Pseudogymnoascus sp. VKM F-4513 (FW-928)]